MMIIISSSSAAFWWVVVAVLLSVIWGGWRMVNWVWLRPKRVEKWLKKQGLNGNTYRLLHGDTRDMITMSKQANSKPLGLFDDIVPRIFPFHHHIINNYGKNSFSWVGPMARVHILDPELIQLVLVDHNLFKKPTPNPLVGLLVSGLSGYEHEKWAKHRKIINPAFHADKLKFMLPAIYSSCCEMISKWEKLVEEEDPCELDAHAYLEYLTNDVISRTTFGTTYEDSKKIFQLQKEQAELTRQVLQSVYIPGWRFLPTKRNKRMKEVNNELKNLIRRIVISRRDKAMKPGEFDGDNDSNNNDFLGLLLKSNIKEIEEARGKKDSNVGMSIEEVVEECKMFYFAGQESTSNLLAWTMVLLSLHPTWQVRAREEIFQVFENNNKPDFDGLNRLKIVTMILYEVLRLYPPGPMFVRTIYKDTKLGHMSLPGGVQFLLPVMLVHRDAELWGDDAKEFKPERFAQGIAKATKNRLCFFPFSWGPRICIGNNFAMMEAKLALAMIIQRFSFELSPSYTHAPTYVLTLKPKNGVHVILHRVA